jgi:hypothetical protein
MTESPEDYDFFL